MSAAPVEPCRDCGTNAEFCCDYARTRAETAIQTAFVSAQELEIAKVKLALCRTLLMDAKEPLIGIGHLMSCLLLRGEGDCDCSAAKVTALLDRIEDALEGP